MWITVEQEKNCEKYKSIKNDLLLAEWKCFHKILHYCFQYLFAVLILLLTSISFVIHLKIQIDKKMSFLSNCTCFERYLICTFTLKCLRVSINAMRMC